jgi:single-strand DNA-binding protein
MANLNKVLLIGRLTDNPTIVPFANGGKVAKVRFAVNNRKKNMQTGQWEEVPVFLDIEAYNRESGRQLADLVEKFLHKGSQVFVEGHLQLDQWLDKQDGSKRSKLKVVLDNLQFLEPRSDSAYGEGGPRSAPAAARPAPARSDYGDAPPEPDMPPPDSPAGGGEGDIPF